MQNSFILQHVSEPDKLIMASSQATGLSFIIVFMVGFFLGLFTDFSFWITAIISISLCVLTQLYMIYRTYQDPYFLNVWMAGLSCKKTKNMFKTKDNHYGD